MVIFNSHGRRRQELVTFKVLDNQAITRLGAYLHIFFFLIHNRLKLFSKVSKPDVLVYVMATIEDEEEEEETVPTQISPVFSR